MRRVQNDRHSDEALGRRDAEDHGLDTGLALRDRRHVRALKRADSYVDGLAGARLESLAVP